MVTTTIASYASRWRFQQFSPSPRHRLALGDGSGFAGGLPIINEDWPVV
jgi:4'-phosphopantetheinyl transferase